jgi:hypothetical protein
VKFIYAGGTVKVAQKQVSVDEFLGPLLQQIVAAV